MGYDDFYSYQEVWLKTQVVLDLKQPAVVDIPWLRTFWWLYDKEDNNSFQF